MAYVSKNSSTVNGVVAGSTIVEGRAIAISAPGVHHDLPVAAYAAENALNVFIAIVPPDNFGRPTRSGMFTADHYSTMLATDATNELVETLTQYNISPSLLYNPTAVSGWLLQAHRGGAYFVPSGNYIDDANIRVPGNLIGVSATAGKWQYTATPSQAVGYVLDANTTDGITIVLDHKSA